MTALDKEILASIRDPDTRDAHKLYDAAITFVAMVDMYSPAVLRAVADALTGEVQKVRGRNEQALMLAMVAFLAHELGER